MRGFYGSECACEWMFDVVCYRGLINTVMMFSLSESGTSLWRMMTLSCGAVWDEWYQWLGGNLQSWAEWDWGRTVATFWFRDVEKAQNGRLKRARQAKGVWMLKDVEQCGRYMWSLRKCCWLFRFLLNWCGEQRFLSYRCSTYDTSEKSWIFMVARSIVCIVGISVSRAHPLRSCVQSWRSRSHEQ